MKNKLHMLIVEDHPIMRRGLKEIIADEYPRATFGEAEDSVTALNVFFSRKWDIVLLDINIPGRGGMEVLAEIHQVPHRAKVLVVSAYPEGEFAIQAFKLGAAGYLSKTQAADELCDAVKKILGGGKYVTASLAEKLAGALNCEENYCAPHDTLSPRELQVLRFIVEGKSIKDIASELKLSEKTVGTYRARLAQKTGLKSNVELTRYAFQRGLTQ